MGTLEPFEIGKPLSILGLSPLAEELRQNIELLASSNSNIVIIGEPGSGKRHAALLIHSKAKHQKGGEFWEIGPQASETELKTLLFQEGPQSPHKARPKILNKLDVRSTLFIKNIHEFNFLNQTRIARFMIQNDIGGNRGKPAARVLISTPVPWKELVQKQRVVASIDHHVRHFEVLVVPPLRKRPEDIPQMIHAFVGELASNDSRRTLKIGPEVLERMKNYEWNGNIKELRLLVEETLENSKNGVLVLPPSFFDEVTLLQDILKSIRAGKRCALEETVGFLERGIIQRALKQTDFDRQKAARQLGLNEKNLSYRMKKYKIWVPDSGTKKRNGNV